MSQKALDRITDKVMAHDPTPPPNPPKVIAGAADRPLQIGEVELPCYVLEDETRVFSQRGMLKGVGFGRASGGGAENSGFAVQKWLKDYISNDLEMALKSPVLFRHPNNRTAHGYPAVALVDLCEAIIVGVG